MVNTEFAKFSATLDEFAEYDSLNDRGVMDPKVWWVTHENFNTHFARVDYEITWPSMSLFMS